MILFLIHVFYHVDQRVLDVELKIEASPETYDEAKDNLTKAMSSSVKS